MRSVLRGMWLGALVFLVGGQAHAAVVTYTTEGSWLAAVGGLSVFSEEFGTSTLAPWLTIDSDCGDASCITPQGVSGGYYYDRVTGPSGGSFVTKWNLSFPTPVYGAGAFWDLGTSGALPGGVQGPGVGISLFAGGNLVGTVSASLTGEFFGFVSDAPFTFVRLIAAADGQETYRIDKLEVAAVPEPGTLLLIGSGIAGLILRRRRNLH